MRRFESPCRNTQTRAGRYKRYWWSRVQRPEDISLHLLFRLPLSGALAFFCIQLGRLPESHTSGVVNESRIQGGELYKAYHSITCIQFGESYCRELFGILMNCDGLVIVSIIVMPKNTVA